jgi:shikimate kinase
MKPIERMPSRTKIFLVGYRGVGKTTVARILAKRLDWNWTDADTALEERYGRSIRAIFAEEGESGFRQKESAMLEEFIGLDKHVLATGGGIVLNPQNRERLRMSGLVFCLTADPPVLHQRLEADSRTAESRPALTVGGLAEIEQLLRIREPLYRECAHWIVDTSNRTPEEVTEVILERM